MHVILLFCHLANIWPNYIFQLHILLSEIQNIFNVTDFEIELFSPGLLFRGVKLRCLRWLRQNLLKCHNQLQKKHHIHVVGPPALSWSWQAHSKQPNRHKQDLHCPANMGTIWGRCCYVTFFKCILWIVLFVFVSFLLLFQGIGATPSPDSEKDVSQVSSMSAVRLALPKNPLWHANLNSLLEL